MAFFCFKTVFYAAKTSTWPVTQQTSTVSRINRRASRGWLWRHGAGGGSGATVLGAAAGAILKPSERVRVPGVVLVPARCLRRCAVPLAGCGAHLGLWRGQRKSPPGEGGPVGVGGCGQL